MSLELEGNQSLSDCHHELNTIKQELLECGSEFTIPEHLQQYFSGFYKQNGETYAQLLTKIESTPKGKTWTEAELNLLEMATLGYCVNNNKVPIELEVKEWQTISQNVQRHWKVCRSKWMAQRSQALSLVPWTKQEDAALKTLHQQYKKNHKSNKWTEISIEISRMTNASYVRLGKQCRERWINKLDPSVSRGPWYREEELKLMELLAKYGKKWSMIASKYFRKERTENSIKNRYHSLIKSELAKQTNFQFIQQQYNLEQGNLQEKEYLELTALYSIIHNLRQAAGLKQYKIQQLPLEEPLDGGFQLVLIKKRKICPLA